MTLRPRLWLAALDIIRLCCGFGSATYLWGVGRCANAEWREPTDPNDFEDPED